MVLYGTGRTIVAAALLLLGAACSREEPPLRLATTTSVRDSGLLDALLPAFRERTGIDVSYVAVGTGLALDLGRRGEADALITHDRAREEAFVREGHALGRREFAASDFVVVGPPADPAGVRGLDAAEAFRRLVESGARFASRGDSSGTHARELRLWEAAGVPRPADSTYVEVRAGMQTTLQFASDRDAYTLTDRATYLAHRERLQLEPLASGEPLLENVYAVLVVDPAAHPEADAERARRFAEWLGSPEASEVIRGLERGGEPLFTVPSSDAPAPGEITVSAAVSLKDALEELTPAFEAAHPGGHVILNLAASGQLQRQIEAGAAADVFVSAAAAHVDSLEARGLTRPATRRDVACNSLVVVVPSDASTSPRDLEEVVAVERLAIGNPTTVPAGAYAREALRTAGLWERVQDRLVLAENVRQALDYVARGEVDAAFVYVTDAAVEPSRARVALRVDPRLHSPIAYPAVVLAASRRPDLARRFVESLASEQARGVLRDHGFDVPPCARAAA